MRRLGILSVILGFVVVLCGTGICETAKEPPMTKAQFADLVIRTTGIELPAGTENLSEEEYFEVSGNILAANGIRYFMGADPNDAVLCSNLVDVLYALLGETEYLSFGEKIAYLVDREFMKSCLPGTQITLSGPRKF